jgi:integrase
MIPKPFKEGKIYHYRFRLGGQRRQRSTGETSPRKAQQVAKDAYEAALLRSRGEEPEPILRDLVAMWVEAHTLRKSEGHVAAVERFGRLHLGDMAGLRLGAITTKVVEDALLVFRADHVMSTTNQWLAYLRLVFKWAVRRKMIRFIPWDVSKSKVQKVPKRRLPVAKTTPFLALVDQLAADEPAIALAIRIMIGLGLRGGEAREAQWEWLDKERSTYTPGKTKGLEAVPRPVPPWMMGILAPLAQVEGPMVLAKDGKRLTAGRIQRVLDDACSGAGILRLTGHRLRGTYATLLAERGTPIQDIMTVLGQKDVRTTLIYLEVDLSRVIGAQKRIAEDTGLNGGGKPS